MEIMHTFTVAPKNNIELRKEYLSLYIKELYTIHKEMRECKLTFYPSRRTAQRIRYYQYWNLINASDTDKIVFYNNNLTNLLDQMSNS